MSDHLNQIKELIEQYEQGLITKAEMFVKIIEAALAGHAAEPKEE